MVRAHDVMARRASPALLERDAVTVLGTARPLTTPAPASSMRIAMPAATAPQRTRWQFSRAFTIGRSRQSDVVIPTTAKTRTVSKLHARVFPVRDGASSEPTDVFAPVTASLDAKPTRWVLQDLEAMNGTSLNGVDAPRGGTVELHDGDELVLASAMRHGARLVLSFLHDDCSAVSVTLDTHDLELAGPPAPAIASPPLRTRTPTTTAAPVRTTTSAAPAVRTTTPTPTAAAARPPVLSPGFQTPPPPLRTTPLSSHAARHTSSTVATKRERHRRDSSERRRMTEPCDAPMEDVDDAAQQRKRSRRLDELDDQDRCMVCPICFEYFHASVTLPCSHTFCGLCVTNWFRASLSCPQCRSDVTGLPVRNRALDDLVHRLVGTSEAYKALVAQRAQTPQLSNDASLNVFTRWQQTDVARVRSVLARQFGEARLQTCRRLGLTDDAMQRASTSQTAIAMQNLLLDWWPYERVRDEGDQRLQVFLHFG